jgi:hypothetical protein
MIDFRCCYCNRRFHMPAQRIGARFPCSCNNTLKVPRRSGGNCRVKTVVDWLVEMLVYGGGGALLGLGLALLILSQWRAALVHGGLFLIAGLMLLGFIAGLLGGERGVTWLGHLIRDQENR